MRRWRSQPRAHALVASGSVVPFGGNAAIARKSSPAGRGGQPRSEGNATPVDPDRRFLKRSGVAPSAVLTRRNASISNGLGTRASGTSRYCSPRDPSPHGRRISLAAWRAFGGRPGASREAAEGGAANRGALASNYATTVASCVRRREENCADRTMMATKSRPSPRLGRLDALFTNWSAICEFRLLPFNLHW